MKLTENFESSEFDSPDSLNSGVNINRLLVNKLQKLRDDLKSPIIIKSGYRTKAHNKIVGGKPNSSHLTGDAADISCFSSSMRYKIVLSALNIGFNRIGIGNNFIHLDIDSSKPKGVIFLY